MGIDRNPLVYVNGAFMPQDKAVISVYDSAFLAGDSIFEGVRVYNGKVFKLNEHIDLLFECAHALMMKLTFTKEDVRNAVLETLRKNDLHDGVHVRIQITRGKMSKPYMDPALALDQPSLVIFTNPRRPDYPREGVRILISSIRRPPPDCLDQKIHTTNKTNSLLAKLEANMAGVAEALMLDTDGFVAECSATNIFFVKDKKVLTSTLKSCKMGITRQLIIEGARELGYEVSEKDISLYEVFNADECFLCGTHGELAPVVEIAGRKIGEGKPGPVTQALSNWYNEQARRDGVPIYP